jgi:transposase
VTSPIVNKLCISSSDGVGVKCYASGDVTDTVFQYIQQRSEPETSQQNADVYKLIEQLQQKIVILSAQNAELEEALKKAQLGFCRHRSEVISPDQLRLAFIELGENSCCENDSTEQTNNTTGLEQQGNSGDSCTDNKPKNRSRHGRRKIKVVPQIIVNIVPVQVQLDGLSNYEQIGHEDSSTLGYRRGGPIELIVRRPKFVPRTSVEPKQTKQTEPGRQKSSENNIEVFEHDVLCVPQNPSFRDNPFVDGAIVRYFPENSLATDSQSSVLIAPLPPRPIDRAMPDPSLLAHLFVDKWGRHLPYYRQEAELERFGWPVPRSNMARWQHECGKLIKPLVDAMWQQALSRSWFAMDATGTAIRGSPEYERGHIFVLIAEAESVLFRFSPTYNSEVVERFFGGHGATILADASANHNVLFKDGSNREASCWAHARRRFVAAFRAGEREEATGVLQTMQALFRIEREIAELSASERLAERQNRSAGLVDQLLRKAAVRQHELGAESLTRKGYVYLDNQRKSFREFLRNGEIPIHNNGCERELRRMVKGRMNWLFHGSEEHAGSAARLLSLVASAELHGLDPELYLQEIFRVIGEYPVLGAGPCAESMGADALSAYRCGATQVH